MHFYSKEDRNCIHVYKSCTNDQWCDSVSLLYLEAKCHSHELQRGNIKEKYFYKLFNATTFKCVHLTEKI